MFDQFVDLIAKPGVESNGEVWLNSLERLYMYGQFSAENKTAEHCIFQIVGVDVTRNSRFKTAVEAVSNILTDC